MIKFLKQFISSDFKRYYWRYLKQQEKAKKKLIKFDGKSPKETFTFIHDTNYWSGRDSISGGGSDLQHTRVVVQQISELISELNIEMVIDIPCGDFAWMQYADLSAVKYIGGDIVDGLILKNKEKFKEKSNVKFKVIDLINDDIPKGEVLINRDCFVHLSFDDIFKALVNIKKSGCKYLLTTTFLDHKQNMDITTGEWRTLNFEEAPFNFKSPIKRISESYNHKEYHDKCLGLWIIEDIAIPQDMVEKHVT